MSESAKQAILASVRTALASGRGELERRGHGAPDLPPAATLGAPDAYADQAARVDAFVARYQADMTALYAEAARYFKRRNPRWRVSSYGDAPVGRELRQYYFSEDLEQQAKELDEVDGSIMIVVATDAPLNARSLDRLASRAMMGLGRTG